MRKFKLLKDLPGYSSSNNWEFKQDKYNEWIDNNAVNVPLWLACMLENPSSVNGFNNLFEEVKEPIKQNYALDFYLNDGANGPKGNIDSSSNILIEKGWDFTEEQAEAVADAIKSVLEYVHKPYKDTERLYIEGNFLSLIDEARKLVQEQDNA